MSIGSGAVIGSGFGERHPVGSVARQASRSVEDGKRAVGVVADGDGGLDEVMAVGLGRDLQAEAAVAHAVILADLAIVMDGQDLVEGLTEVADESRAVLRRRHREAGVVGGQKERM